MSLPITAPMTSSAAEPRSVWFTSSRAFGQVDAEPDGPGPAVASPTILMYDDQES
jgi:hypothetical protein